MLCVLMLLRGAEQVHIGSQLPNVQLLLPSAADPEPESYVMTQDLFNGAAAPRMHFACLMPIQQMANTP